MIEECDRIGITISLKIDSVVTAKTNKIGAFYVQSIAAKINFKPNAALCSHY